MRHYHQMPPPPQEGKDNSSRGRTVTGQLFLDPPRVHFPEKILALCPELALNSY